MRLRNKTRSMKAICRGAPWLALFLAIGCAPAVRPTVTADEARTTIEPVESPAAIVDVAEAPGGFTITQQVTVTKDVRADYEAAVRMLEEARYQSAIALLLDVSEREPAVTAAQEPKPWAARYTSVKVVNR